LVFSNFLLYVLVLRATVRTNRVDHSIASLVREMAKREFARDNPDPTGAPITVVLPAYNEGDNIGSVLAQMPSEAYGLAVDAIVVVDGSTDHTEAVVRELNVPVATHVINRGGGAALRAGYDLAVARGAEVIVTLDADGQHLPAEIPVLVNPILDGEADLVNGSRVLGHHEKDSRIRSAGVVFFSGLVSLLTWTKITDCSNAFRAIRADEVGKLDLRQQQFHTTELLIEALKKGLRVLEVPITIQRRTSGTSKKPSTLPYGWGFTKAIITTWLR
jgi:glycosyltransferase involved in cell wall biosynthesis